MANAMMSQSNQSHDAKFDDQSAVATLHIKSRIRHMEDAGDVLRAKRGSAHTIGNDVRAEDQDFERADGKIAGGKVGRWRGHGEHCLQVKYSGFRSGRGCARLTWFGLLAPDRPLFQGVVTGG